MKTGWYGKTREHWQGIIPIEEAVFLDKLKIMSGLSIQGACAFSYLLVSDSML